MENKENVEKKKGSAVVTIEHIIWLFAEHWEQITLHYNEIKRCFMVMGLRSHMWPYSMFLFCSDTIYYCNCTYLP